MTNEATNADKGVEIEKHSFMKQKQEANKSMVEG
jgi:hypothetical protein